MMKVSNIPVLLISSSFALLSSVMKSARHITSQYLMTEWSISSITAAIVNV